MKRIRLGKSQIEASEITFGAWAIGGWMWGGTDRNNALAALKEAYDAGITTIDTAPAYGQGLSEEICGEAIREIGRDKIQVFTKFGLRWDTKNGTFFFKSRDNAGKEILMHKYASKGSIIKECEDSLKRLGTDYIDLYQIHWPDPSTPVSETMEALAKLLQQGKIKAAGVCNYSALQMEEAEKTIALTSNQVPYSMLVRDIELNVIPYAVKHGNSIIAYSPLQRGVLTGKLKPGHIFNEGDTRKGNIFYTDDNIKRINTFLEKLKPLAQDKNVSISSLILRWTLEQPGISLVLAGARNPEQARDNSRAGDILLTSEEMSIINNNLKELKLTNIG